MTFLEAMRVICDADDVLRRNRDDLDRWYGGAPGPKPKVVKRESLELYARLVGSGDVCYYFCDGTFIRTTPGDGSAFVPGKDALFGEWEVLKRPGGRGRKR